MSKFPGDFGPGYIPRKATPEDYANGRVLGFIEEPPQESLADRIATLEARVAELENPTCVWLYDISNPKALEEAKAAAMAHHSDKNIFVPVLSGTGQVILPQSLTPEIRAGIKDLAEKCKHDFGKSPLPAIADQSNTFTEVPNPIPMTPDPVLAGIVNHMTESLLKSKWAALEAEANRMLAAGFKVEELAVWHSDTEAGICTKAMLESGEKPMPCWRMDLKFPSPSQPSKPECAGDNPPKTPAVEQGCSTEKWTPGNKWL
jgi:hypothetical protein